MHQSQALEIMKAGANVFLTGQPGSGKTYVINEYVRYLRSFGIDPAITACTGIAATHIGGLTIHSWSGIGVKETLSSSELAAIVANRRLARRFAKTNVLIIDEVSMLKPGILDLVDAVCRRAKKSPAPFGGLQAVLVGDFFQLPPVMRSSGRLPADDLFRSEQPRFAFEAASWQRANLVVCYLTEQYRQDDPEFLGMLKAIRENNFGARHLALVKSQLIDFANAPSGAPKLFSHNVDVDLINNKKLAELPGRSKDFIMSSRGPKPLVAALQKGCLSPSVLSLKTGAAVMFTKNDYQSRFVNGTLGTVISFDEVTGYPAVETKAGSRIATEPSEWTLEENGVPRASLTQLPLRLAWAITIHKSQGMSLDEAVMDLSGVFEFGQGYVALSRVRRLSGLHLAGYCQRAFEVDPLVLAKDEEFLARSLESEAGLADVSPADRQRKQRDFIFACGADFDSPAPATQKRIKQDTYAQTLALWQQKKDIAAIARERGLTQGTIVGHLEKLAAKKLVDPKDLVHLLAAEQKKNLAEISAAFDALGFERLSPVFEKLNGRYSYDQLRLFRLALAVSRADEPPDVLS